jgi:putative endonuclease
VIPELLQHLRRFQREPEPAARHLALGAYGERLALEYLKQCGYRMVATNFVAPIGHNLQGRPITGEIDIIAYDESGADPTLAFIEVKTRASADIAAPQAAVDLRKQRQIIRAARIYRRLVRVEEEPYRYDVVSVLAAPGAPAEVMLLRGYFTEESFYRSRWWSREF